MSWFNRSREIRELQETTLQLLNNQSNLSSTIATLYEQVVKQRGIIDNLTATNGGLEAIEYFDDEDSDDEIN